jgi:hypothetical protein
MEEDYFWRTLFMGFRTNKTTTVKQGKRWIGKDFDRREARATDREGTGVSLV